MNRVAILGAGFQGVCAALELAGRGVDVDLYDRHDACITQAGVCNEGKIHLGFVYANDPSVDTTRLLVRGALIFDRALRRWLGSDLTHVGLSTPHAYAVHRDSMLPPAEVLAHFARVRDVIRETAAAIPGSTYLGQDPRTVAFEARDLDGAYDQAAIAAVIHTDERAVDVAVLAALLRQRVAAEPRIAFQGGTEVTGAARDDDGIRVSLTSRGVAHSQRYDQAINCLWDGKLAIDAVMRFMPGYRSLYRLKYALNLVLPEPHRALPSTTFVVGSFGDIVQFDDRRVYLSWYPVACRARSTAITPPDWPRQLTDDGARSLIEATIEAFAALVPSMRALAPGTIRDASVAGGIIVAAGETDINDPHSRLHTRTDVGVRSLHGYHSVDTGKYTLAPMYAIEVADRVCASAR